MSDFRWATMLRKLKRAVGAAPREQWRCFACGRSGDERTGFFKDLACHDCKLRARLTSTSALVTTLLESERPYPLEGSGLNTIINPVKIDGHRGWLDFAAGGWAVYAELHKSRDYFDFAVQHRNPGSGILSFVNQGLRSSAAVSEILKGIEGLSEFRPHWGSNLDWPILIWNSTKDGIRAQGNAGPLHTNADAWAAADAWVVSDPEPSDLEPMCERLFELANTYRTHVDEDSS